MMSYENQHLGFNRGVGGRIYAAAVVSSRSFRSGKRAILAECFLTNLAGIGTSA